MKPVENLLTALREHGHQPHKSSTGWSCRCPAHDDREPSLSITAGDDGRALVNCHAGCTVDEVCGPIGLRPADLFVSCSSRRNGHARKARLGVTVTNTSLTAPRNAMNGDTKKHPTADEAVAELERRQGPRSTMWTYHDARREPVGLVLRWNLAPKERGGKPGKRIQPVSKLATGWANKGMPTPRPLYSLPDLLATKPGDRVYVAEGEKAAEALRAVGLTATTSPHGAKSPAKANWSPLSRRDVVVSVDNDDAGEQYGASVVRLVTDAGAKSVRVVRLVELWADMPEGGDMADLLEHRNGDCDLTRADVEALADKTEPDTLTPEASAVPAFTPFPAEVLPEPIRRFVSEAAIAIQCDVSYIALPLLSGLASAIGNTHRIALKGSWTEPAILWMALVGESGTAKSPALELALRPIRKRQHQAMKERAEAMKQYADALAMYERDTARWKKSESDTPPPAKPELPMADRCWTDDATTEAVIALLQQNPRGLLMVRDELAGWFNFDRYVGGKGGGDAAKWLELFGGRPMMVDRKTGSTLYVPRGTVSIAGGIQPETLRRALRQEHRDNGLAARLLLAYPPRKRKRWIEAEVKADTEGAVAMVFDRLFGLTPETDGDGDVRPRLVTLADDAKRVWVAFYDEHGLEQWNLSGDDAAAWSKLEGYAARLALVVHLTRWAASDATLRDPSQVDEASMGAGVVLARWFGGEARRVYAILAESDAERESRQLIDVIRRRGGDVSGRELVQASRMFRNVADAEAALSGLMQAGAGSWVTPKQRGRGGPKARRFVLSPVYRNRVGDTGTVNPVGVDQRREVEL